mmetsp:Transcript_37205/g.57122  ORF Transcript_37205/g.57122 Transcript_37205/m.57122 type:complete len:99 (-) Transcript_37205:2403-2699(-)
MNFQKVDELCLSTFKKSTQLSSGSKKAKKDADSVNLPPTLHMSGTPTIPVGSSQKENIPKSKVISLPKINHEEAMKKLTTIMNRSAKQSDDKLGGLRI